MPDDPFRRPTFGSAVFYKDPRAALDRLAEAFGFERSMLITNDDGIDAHCACARAAGATIAREPNDEFYGDREAEKASGLTIDAPAWP